MDDILYENIKIKFGEKLERDFIPKIISKKTPKKFFYKALAIFWMTMTYLLGILMSSLIIYCSITDGKVLAILLIIPIILITKHAGTDFYHSHDDSISNAANKEIVPELCKLFNNLKWSDKLEYDNDIKSSGLIEPYTSQEFDNVITGNFKDINFTLCDGYLTKRSDNNGYIYIYSVFNGLIIEIELKDYIENDILIIERPKSTQEKISMSDDIKTEEFEFNKQFQICVKDKDRIKNIITPLFKKKLVELTKIFDDNIIRCIFHKNKFIVVADKTSIFKNSTTNKSIINREAYYNFFNKIIKIYEFIDYFKQDKQKENYE